MSDHAMPEGWHSLSVAVFWGIFAFAFGFEAVVNFNDWLLGHGPVYAAVAIADVLACLFISAIALVLWKGSVILPGAFRESANKAAGNAYLWVAVLLVIFVILSLPHFMTFAEASSDFVARQERDRYKQQLDSKNDELKSVKRELTAIQQPPANIADTQTWIRLNFDGNGKPTEVASVNVHWSWLTLPEVDKRYALDFVETVGSPTESVTTAAILFLSFDVPIRPGPLSIKPSHGSLPQYDPITQADDRNVILLFHGQITNRSLEIRIK